MYQLNPYNTTLQKISRFIKGYSSTSPEHYFTRISHVSRYSENHCSVRLPFRSFIIIVILVSHFPSILTRKHSMKHVKIANLKSYLITLQSACQRQKDRKHQQVLRERWDKEMHRGPTISDQVKITNPTIGSYPWPLVQSRCFNVRIELCK